MESLGLSEFLRTTGGAVHALNTICVGLSGVETGQYAKPVELTVSWSTADCIASARKSRSFAIKASFVFVEEGLLQYLKFVARHPNASEAVKQALRTDSSAAEKVEELSKVVALQEPYWAPIVCLMIHWRNKFVHLSSKADLKHDQKKVIEFSKERIKENHSAIDIIETLEHFRRGDVTLKDASTLISIAIRFARNIDEYLQLATGNIESVKFYIEYLGLAEEYAKSIHANGVDTRARKIRAFFKTHIPHLSEVLISSIVAKPPELNSGGQ